MGIYGVIDFNEEEIDAAGHWYGGQGSMLYAITSTGSLKRGTIRPSHHDGTPMTDDEWIVDLAERLESEAEEAARDAGKQARKAKGAEKKELQADQEGLRSIAFKANQFIRERTSKKSSHATKHHHATKKKSSAELDRDIAETLAKDYRVLVRVEGAPKPVHVSRWMTYAQAEHAAKNHKAMIRDRGWTHVVEIEDKSGTVTRMSHSTIRDEALYPTAEARRQVQTIRHRDEFPEILAISMRADGTNYNVKVTDPKNKRGYDLVDVLVHHNGARSIKSASRSRTTPERASKIVSKYLAATGA